MTFRMISPRPPPAGALDDLADARTNLVVVRGRVVELHRQRLVA